jgi:hypothetical protein
MAIDTWAKLIELPNADFQPLVEINPGLHFECGSDWTSEGSSTYSHACAEEEVNAVTDDGVELTKKTTIAQVKATAGTYYFDKFHQKIYVHAFGGDNLSSSSCTVTIVVFCWKYFAGDAVEFNGHQYYPIVRKESLPVLDLTVDDIVEGIYKFNFGAFRMSNDKWWDKAGENYIWTNRRVMIKLGGESLPYSEYCLFFVGRISDYYVSDEEVIFSVKDIRVGTFAQLPIDHYWKSNYPNMPDEHDGKAIPLFYGEKKNIIPVCIDDTVGGGGKWKLTNRKIKAIDEVRWNDEALIAGVDYTTDLNNAEFTLNISFHPEEGDYLEVDGKGFVDASNNLYTKGAEIAKDILKTYLGFIDDELDLVSFNNTNSKRTAPLGLYIDVDESSREILQTIGRSIVAFFAPTEDGKLSFEAYEPSTPAGTLKLTDRDYKTWRVKKDNRFIRNKVKVFYDKNPKTQDSKSVERNNYAVLYKYGVRETLSIKTYLKLKTDAENMAEAVRDMCSRPITIADTSFGIKGFKLFPTRKVVLSRSRAVDATGAWNEKTFRIRSVVKDTSRETTSIVALDDLQSLGESLCQVCYSCQTCDVCQVVVDCQTCDSCEVCDTCQVCDSAQQCTTCDICDSCELCNTCEATVTCAKCDTCQLCNVCATCNTVQECTVCDVCDSCQSQYACAKCDTCETCVACMTCDSAQDCTVCDTCDACMVCNTCQQQVSCQKCDTCQSCVGCMNCNVAQDCTTCDVCDSCEKCNTCQQQVSCAKCDSCQLCVGCMTCVTTEDCVTCDICNTCEVQVSCAKCDSCQSCVNCMNCNTAQDCTGCDVCDSCQSCVTGQCSTCVTTCQTCVSCMGCYGTCDVCYICQECDSCEEAA